MANATSIKLARDIIDDLKGNQYYKSPGILAQFIGGFVGSADRATQVADAILEDWNGARYYEQEEVLAQYLEGQSD